MAMKKQLIPCALLSACLMLGAGTAAMADTPAAGPNLVAHYTFADANNVGKDAVGTQDLTVQGKTVGSAGTAKQVEGPINGMKALEFDQTYSLMSDADDVLDDLKEFTITYLVSANDAKVLRSNVFSTGAANGNNFKNAGLNHLIDMTNGTPDFRLFGGNSADSAQAGDSKWDANQRKNDDGKNGKNFWANRIAYNAETDTVGKPCEYAANEWYRVVITVKLSDGTKTSEETVLWPNKSQGDAYYPGTGVQSVYMEKMNAVTSKSSLVESQNYYEVTLPHNLTSVKNENLGLLIGAAYKLNSDTPVIDTNAKNYAMFIGKMADFRIYDKALTQDQIVELYTTNDLDDGSGSSTESNTSNTSTVSNTSTTSTTSTTSNASKAPTSTASAPPTGVAGNMLPLLVLIPAAGVAGVLVVRRKGKASK